MDSQLSFTQSMLPPVNFLPRSVHLLRQVAGAEDWAKYEVHVCAAACCTGHVYADVQRDHWNHKEVCPKCSTLRFKTSTLGGRSAGST
jgi:hypothetical protein